VDHKEFCSAARLQRNEKSVATITTLGEASGRGPSTDPRNTSEVKGKTMKPMLCVVLVILGFGLLGLALSPALAGDSTDVNWGPVDGSSRKDLSGNHRLVTIGGVNGDGRVSIHDLTGQEIRILNEGNTIFGEHKGSVNGSAVVLITNTNASVVFEDKIDGSPTVEINTTGNVLIQGKIDGDSHVTIKNCRNFTVQGKIDGSARVTYHATGQADVPNANGNAVVTAN
jgi:hypothetical protein